MSMSTPSADEVTQDEEEIIEVVAKEASEDASPDVEDHSMSMSTPSS